jgi:amidohydrolase
VTYNNPSSPRAVPSLRKIAGESNVKENSADHGGGGFRLFRAGSASFFYMVGVTPQGTDVTTAPANHSPLFYS